MEPSVPNATGSSTMMESCISGQTPVPSSSKNSYALEINLISAQDLAPVSKSMQPYAVAWIYPNRKNITQVDQEGHKNPKWNEKFNFRLKDGMPEDATVTVEIYTLSWFRDVLVGSVNVPIRDLIAPLAQSPSNSNKNTRFVTLQIRTSTGSPQGILSIGVTLKDSAAATKSMPLNRPTGKTVQQEPGADHPIDDHKMELISKIEMWRSMSTGSGLHNDEDFTLKPGSIVNGSMCDNGSELCSDIGPSASVVAAELAMKLMPPPPPPRAARKGANSDDSSSILGEMTLEQAQAKGYKNTNKERWRKAAAAANDGDDSELSVRNPKRSAEGSLFSCFAAGIEFTIVCGASKKPNSASKKPSGGGGRKKKSDDN